MLDEKDIQMFTKLLNDTLDQKLDQKLDGKFDAFEEHMGSKLTALEERMDSKLTALEQRMDGKLTALEERMDGKLDRQTQALRGEFLSVIESEVTPKLQLLAEGQEAILEKMAPVSRIEALEADVIVLKDAVKYLSEKLQKLEMAQ